MCCKQSGLVCVAINRVDKLTGALPVPESCPQASMLGNTIRETYDREGCNVGSNRVCSMSRADKKACCSGC